MYLFDSNIIIYSAQPKYAYLRSLINNPTNFISHITYLEVLGYHKLDAASKEYFELLLPRLNHIPIDFATIVEATRLRQGQKMSVGDAIIAATALRYDLTVCTNNVADFANIKGIITYNPTKA